MIVQEAMNMIVTVRRLDADSSNLVLIFADSIC